MSGAGYGNHGEDTKGVGEGGGSETASPRPRSGDDRPASASGGSSQGTAPGEGGMPAAGPHADQSLTNSDATPGAGTLPRSEGGEVDPGAG